MLKFANHDVVFQEVPDQITLAINISNCPNHCPGCHSKYLWKDVGDELNKNALERLISKNDGITCVCFMGGDQAPAEVSQLASFVKQKYPKLKVGWYSGKEEISPAIDIRSFDYVKTGRYDEKCGPLSSPTTNQRMVKRLADGRLETITHFFQKKKNIQPQKHG
ncbi:MAG: anaerobic ribonucleoside-triphosphate reductase activating protein [Bacteroidales bacterium]|nr:anaerobic ribonucleoside-triphosphate reductase activating protein [Bacteroidales bacterium]MBR4198738.1 anaerobic ribonucleoside-triphosphate reductase activating protein [Bacteroidales bacterium]